MQLEALVHFINQRHGTVYRLAHRLPGGTRGAYELMTAQGERAVLKCATHPQRTDQLRRTALIVARLRAVGYPAPAYLLVGAMPDGTSYYVQEFMPARPLEQITPPILDPLLAVNDLQGGHRLAVEQNWSTYVRRVVFAGESGWAGALRGYSAATADLLTAVEQTTRPYSAAVLPVTDIVHGDFGQDNVLVDDGRITAVIDLEAAGCGTRAIDLAVLLGWGYDETTPVARARLLSRIAEIAGPGGAAICLSYQIINMVAYAMGHHEPSGVAHRVQQSWQSLDGARRCVSGL